MRVHRRGRSRIAAGFQRKAAWICAAACLGAMVCMAGAGLLESRAQTPQAQAGASSLAGTDPQSAGQDQQTRDQQIRDQQIKDQRQKQIADDCATLLKLANGLKAEVDKTTKDELSVGVVRKAGAIEQLAHRMRAR